MYVLDHFHLNQDVTKLNKSKRKNRLDIRRHKMVKRNTLILESEKNCNTFHSAMRFPIKVAQVFSFFPIYGIESRSYKSLKFRWISWKIAYSLLTLALFVGNFFILCYNIYEKGINMNHVGYFVFYLEALILKILYVKLAREWPDFVTHWHKCEMNMKNYDPAENMTKYIKKVSSTILMIAFAEHNILTYNKLAKSFKKYTTISEVLEDYFARVAYWDMFYVTKYSAWKGMIFQVLNWQRTFMWTYTDVFIILIGISFCFKLKQIKGRIRNMVILKTADINCWRSVREDYAKLEKLFNVINDKLSWIFLVSFAANMYFILLQLYQLIKSEYTRLELMYLLISFFLLVGRLTCVCYYGGAPSTQTIAIVKSLNSVDRNAYNIEVQRLITYIATTEMVFTGKNFFKITQNLILKIGSAIMAYELVMSQINEYTQ